MADSRSVADSAARVLEIVENFNQEENSQINDPVRESAKKNNAKNIKKKKKALKKEVVTKIVIAIAVLAMTIGGAFAKKVVTGKEALRKAGVEALPRDEYSVSMGSSGLTVMNIKTNQQASYGDYIGAVKANAVENNIEPISVYLAVEDVVGSVVAKDAAGREFTIAEIVDAALEYVDTLNEVQGRGGR